MALFDIFKKKKKPEKKEVKREARKAPKKAVKKPVARPAEVKEAVAVPLKPKKVSPNAYRILQWPHITEKATDLTKINQYVFNVYEGATKPEIKRTVEEVYGVKVIDIRVIKIPPKQRKLGRAEGWRKAYKKAIVRLAEGQKIEILPR